ncbi:MAG: AraC family transcriptional regulator [Solobacterium sp.]|nr:helix-turn-helix domain-containing protein [Solobacterium sp.]MCR5450605.1 AraC family transcriptional regulator [Solobacterium sp.]
MNDIIYVGKHTITYNVTKHIHNNWELIYCTSGKGEIIFHNRSLPYEEDSVALIPPKEPHINYGEEGFTNIHVILDDPSFNVTEGTVISGLTNGFLRDAFAAAFYYYSTTEPESNALLPIYGTLIGTLIESMVTEGTEHNSVVTQIVDIILKNYPDANFDLNACLESFSFSTEYLKRVFKQELGMTPRQYLMERRLENAARSLAIGGENHNISQITRQCGFSDPLYFSKLFKKRYGVSPKNYSQKQPLVADSDSTKIYL